MPTRKKLYILGAGRFARELEGWLELIPAQQRDWDIVGFLHQTEKMDNSLKEAPSDYRIIGNWDDFVFQENDLVVFGFADPVLKKRAYGKLVGKVRFHSFIAPHCLIGKFNLIDQGVIICPHSLLTTNVKLGFGVTINCGTQIGHDSRIGAFSSLMSNVDIGGDCNIGESVYIGTGATVIPGRRIDEGAKIGAGSVVVSNLKRGTRVFGNPARKY